MQTVSLNGRKFFKIHFIPTDSREHCCDRCYFVDNIEGCQVDSIDKNASCFDRKVVDGKTVYVDYYFKPAE